MNKKIRTLCAAAAVLMLSGCFKTRMVIDVSKDGTASGSLTLLMSEAMLTMDGSTVEEALEEMKQNYADQAEDGKIETVREGEGENAYAGVKVSGVPLEEGNYQLVKEGNKITLTIPLSEVTDEIVDEAGGEESGMSAAMLKQAGAEATLTVNMPAKAESNLGTVNGNSVTVDLFSSQASGNLIVTCTLGASIWMIAAVIAGAGLLIGVTAFLFTRKKQNI